MVFELARGVTWIGTYPQALAPQLHDQNVKTRKAKENEYSGLKIYL
jgi:hypothetical protein